MKILNILLLVFIFLACNENRMPPAPIEIDRPFFVEFNDPGNTAFAVDQNSSFTFTFNEAMSPSSFNGNFHFFSDDDAIEGVFSSVENSIIFKPEKEMLPAEIYQFEFNGKVKDAHGNSIDLDDKYAENFWIFSAGEYSKNGFNKIYITDEDNDKIYIVSQFNQLIDSIEIDSPVNIAASPNEVSLIAISKTAPGLAHFIDPQTNLIMQSLTVGNGPSDVVISDEKAWVINRSGNSFSIIDLITKQVTETIDLNFKPSKICATQDFSKIYITSNDRNKKGLVAVYDGNTNIQITQIQNVISTQNVADIITGPSSENVYLAEAKKRTIAIISTFLDTVISTIELPDGNNSYLKASENYIYVTTTNGILYKIDQNNNTVLDSVHLSSRCEGIGLTPGNEIAYVSTPDDTTISILETNAMQVIRKIKISNTARGVLSGLLKY